MTPGSTKKRNLARHPFRVRRNTYLEFEDVIRTFLYRINRIIPLLLFLACSHNKVSNEYLVNFNIYTAFSIGMNLTYECPDHIHRGATVNLMSEAANIKVSANYIHTSLSCQFTTLTSVYAFPQSLNDYAPKHVNESHPKLEQ